MPEIPSRCVDRLQGYVKRGLYRRGMTHYAPRLVDDNKFPLDIVMDYFYWFISYGRFVSVYNISEPEVQSHMRYCEEVKTLNSILSPFRIIVSGLAISPLMVVTPDSRAYL